MKMMPKLPNCGTEWRRVEPNTAIVLLKPKTHNNWRIWMYRDMPMLHMKALSASATSMNDTTLPAKHNTTLRSNRIYLFDTNLNCYRIGGLSLFMLGGGSHISGNS